MRNFFKNLYDNNFVYSTKEKLSKLTIFSIIVLNIIVYLILIEITRKNNFKYLFK